MNKNGQIVLGLDIGSGSVGYSLINTATMEILYAGSYIFPAQKIENNKTRREKRGSRRLKRRRKYRIEKAKTLFQKYNIYVKEDIDKIKTEPFYIKRKALYEEISNSELCYILLSSLKHRGVSYTDESLNIYVCEDEANRFDEYKRLLENGGLINDNSLIGVRNGSKIYTRSDYIKELTKILDTQIIHNKNIDEAFKKEYLNIFSSQRAYYEGPGDELNRTDYGIYRTDNTTWKNLYENLIGKCTIFPDEFRAPKLSYTAQRFNFLNDINNLTIGEDRKITAEEKKIIEFTVLHSAAPRILDIIATTCNVSKESIRGFRIDSNNGKLFSTFNLYRKVLTFLKNQGFGNISISEEEFNYMANIASIDGDLHEKTLLLKERLDAISPSKFTESFINAYFKAVETISKRDLGWHSLSYKAMNLIMDDLVSTSKNQSQIFIERNCLDYKKEIYIGKKYMPTSEINKGVLNPAVKQSLNAAIKVINAIIKQFGYPDNIIIELSRTSFGSDLKQTDRKKAEDEIRKSCAKLNLPFSESCLTEKNITKYLLWKEQIYTGQKHYCLYSGREISELTLMKDILSLTVKTLEIDHIIPISISCDDSFSNKALVYYEANRNKGNKTPYQYLNDERFAWLKEYCLSKENKDDIAKEKIEKSDANKNISDSTKAKPKRKTYVDRKKIDNLLTEEDITKIDVLRGFINRNLSDTAYASRLLKNELIYFSKANHLPMHITTIKGDMTALIRKTTGVKEKDRSNYNHHAIDASIIAASITIPFIQENNIIRALYIEKHKDIPVKRCNTFLSEKEFYKKLVIKNKHQFLNSLDNYNFKIAHKPLRKNNRKISDETIYGLTPFDNKHNVPYKRKDDFNPNDKNTKYKKKSYYDLYDTNPKSSKNTQEELTSIIRSDNEKEKENLLIYLNDKKTYEILESIANSYPNEKRPFSKYKEEHGFIRKYSKKGNGPIINRIYYYSQTVNKCLDISHKYPSEINHKKVVLTKLSVYRTDIYYSQEKDSYKLVGLYNYMYKHVDNKYILDIDLYNEEKELCKIDNSYDFAFSLYPNNILGVNYKDGSNEEYIYNGLKDAKASTISSSNINNNVDKSVKKIVVRKDKPVEKLYKVNTDVLGNKFYVFKEDFTSK